MKKPNGFGRSKSSNPLAHLFVPNLTNILKANAILIFVTS
ncbi:hypothetical protein HMPREF1408_00041 [Helicobacter pylori GAM245Ai]|nr:hypothetical protein HMPREF1408_00041 [Helicobacter pylori GAM245Ai]